ncbi:uncharacterized protein PAC_02248 [Phialocephala subalpina]|uniref:Uncharacterized protein n=1 Tax=Phialocephala subalpina TaxID=576137 RepID=A0A1L7WHX7_9HELO|nr:uncharacterized protein PAC_02248 [Phialocephala subalpina]
MASPSKMAYTMILKALALLMTFIPLMMVSGLSVQIGDSAVTADYAMGGAIVFKGRIQDVEVELSGTVQEMYAEFAKMYSDVVANATAAHKNLDTRNSNVSSKDHYCCPIGGQPNWQGADAGRIDQGITYLDNFQGVCNTGGGPGNWRENLSPRNFLPSIY